MTARISKAVLVGFCAILYSWNMAAQSYISALDAAKQLNAEIFWDPLTQDCVFTAHNRSVYCRVSQPLVFFDSEAVCFDELPCLRNGILSVPKKLFSRMEAFFSGNAGQSLFRVGAILIDPGHGGKDAGAVGSYTENGKKITLYEKNITLSVSLELYKRLKKMYPEKKILMTRSNDTYLPLEERVDKANNVVLQQHEAIIYISIHANSAGFNNRPYGFEVWYLPPEYRRDLVDKNTASKEILPILNSMLEEEFTTESILIAKNILDGLDSEIGAVSKNRGIRENDWFVVKNAKMPSVLVEVGFVTNPEEAKRLNTHEYLQQCAVGIYNGIVAFITRFEHV